MNAPRESKTRKNRPGRALWCTLLAGLLVTGAFGCQSEDAEATTETPTTEEAPAEAALVEGWDCDEIEACFGLRTGSTRTFERKVGTRIESEIRTIVDRIPVEQSGDEEGDADPTRHVFVESDGTRRYEARPDELAIELRGKLLPALRFPLRAGDSFEIEDGGATVSMTIEATHVAWSTPAGTFEPCLVHEARFDNSEQPDSAGLRVETTFCQGVGEVARSIELPALPLPVEFNLLGHEGTLISKDTGDPG